MSATIWVLGGAGAGMVVARFQNRVRRFLKGLFQRNEYRPIGTW